LILSTGGLLSLIRDLNLLCTIASVEFFSVQTTELVPTYCSTPVTQVVTRHLLSAPGRTFHCIASVCMALWHSQSLAQWPSMLTQISCMTLQSTRQHWTV